SWAAAALASVCSSSCGYVPVRWAGLLGRRVEQRFKLKLADPFKVFDNFIERLDGSISALALLAIPDGIGHVVAEILLVVAYGLDINANAFGKLQQLADSRFNGSDLFAPCLIHASLSVISECCRRPRSRLGRCRTRSRRSGSRRRGHTRKP